MRVVMFVLVMLFYGCVSIPISYPKWVTTIKPDTIRYYYATAEGYTQKEAIENALDAIASKISVTINSSYQSSLVVINDKYTKTIQNTILANVKNIEFVDYKILKSQKIGDKYFVLISVDRIKNAQAIIDKIKLHIHNYQLALQKKNFKIYLRILKQLKTDLAQCFIAKSLYNSADVNLTIAKLMDLQSQIHTFLNSLSFTIKSPYPQLNSIIKEVLTKQGFNISNHGNTIITLQARIKKYKLIDYYIYQEDIDIKMYYKHKLISLDTLSVAGKSVINYQQAKENMLINFRDKFYDIITKN
ncbi:MAG: hypothetical protein GXO40_00990 [Epsilonproteobacteria bacterium]|nr:hypothetical protein [Campylobacterota bacterium]